MPGYLLPGFSSCELEQQHMRPVIVHSPSDHPLIGCPNRERNKTMRWVWANVIGYAFRLLSACFYFLFRFCFLYPFANIALTMPDTSCPGFLNTIVPVASTINEVTPSLELHLPYICFGEFVKYNCKFGCGFCILIRAPGTSSAPVLLMISSSPCLVPARQFKKKIGRG